MHITECWFIAVMLLVETSALAHPSRYSPFECEPQRMDITIIDEENYRADLNGDGRQEKITLKPLHGCGLAEGYTDITIETVTECGASSNQFTTLYPEENDFIVVDGIPCIIHTGFLSIEQCLDGRKHGFWVYNLLTIDGDRLIVRNDLVDGFPKFIQYTHRPNHKPTNLLSAEQKTIPSAAFKLNP